MTTPLEPDTPPLLRFLQSTPGTSRPDIDWLEDDLKPVYPVFVFDPFRPWRRIGVLWVFES